MTDIDWSYMYTGLDYESDEDIPAQVGNDIDGVVDYAPVYVFDDESKYPQCVTCKGPNLSLHSDRCIQCRALL